MKPLSRPSRQHRLTCCTPPSRHLSDSAYGATHGHGRVAECDKIASPGVWGATHHMLFIRIYPFAFPLSQSSSEHLGYIESLMTHYCLSTSQRFLSFLHMLLICTSPRKHLRFTHRNGAVSRAVSAIADPRAWMHARLRHWDLHSIQILTDLCHFRVVSGTQAPSQIDKLAGRSLTERRAGRSPAAWLDQRLPDRPCLSNEIQAGDDFTHSVQTSISPRSPMSVSALQRTHVSAQRQQTKPT